MNNLKVLIPLFLFFLMSNINTAEAHFIYTENGATKPAFYHKAKKKADANPRYIKIKERALKKMTATNFEELETILIGVMHMDEKSQANYVNYALDAASNNDNSGLSGADILQANLFDTKGGLKDVQDYIDLAKDLMEKGNEFDQFMGGIMADIFSKENLFTKKGDRKSDGQLRGEFIGAVLGGIGGFVVGILTGNPMKGATIGAKIGKAIGGFFGKLFSKKGKKKGEETEVEEGEAQGVWAGPNNDETHYGGQAWPF